MKKTLIQICSAVGLLIGLMASTHAQSATQYRAQIGFDFGAREQMLPAGKYILQSLDSESVKWFLRSADDKKMLALISLPPNERHSDETKIVFRRYGEHYFLAGLKTPDGEITLPKSRAERDFLKAEPEDRFADARKPEIVAVALAIGTN